jgi:hypothetical protein
LSPDAFAVREGRDSIADQMNVVFRAHNFPTVQRAVDERIGGWMVMYQMLRNGTWKIADHCNNIIETLPMMIRDDKNIEDCAKIDGDDAADSCRYGLRSRYRPRDEPFQSQLQKKIETIEDPTHAMMLMKQEIAKNKKRTRPVRRQSKRFMRSRYRRKGSGVRRSQKDQGWGVFVREE